MTRQVVTKTVTIPASPPVPARTLVAGQVVELSAAEVTAVTSAGGAVRAVTFRDQLGEGAAASNSD
jgi:hypothetical protein